MKELDEQYVQQQISYFFKNPDLLHQAFTHSTYADECKCESNQVLEFYGDEVLDFFVAKILSDRYGYIKSEEDVRFDSEEDFDEYVTLNGMTEHDLTEVKERLVNNKMLAHRIEKMGLQDYLYLGSGAEKKNTQNEMKTKSDLFEAILGAIAIDSNWNADQLENSVSFMLNLDFYLDHGFTEDDDYVSLVQHWWQTRIGCIPEYHYEEKWDMLRGLNNYDETKYYEATLSFLENNVRRVFEGSARTKNEARYECAKKVYEYLKAHDLLESIRDVCPSSDELTKDNAINVLQEMAQKGYTSMPEYHQSNEPEYDRDGSAWWTCKCIVRSCAVEEAAKATNKKEAKKYAAYLCICDIMGYMDRYSK